MRFRTATLKKIASGEVTLAFRRWNRPLAKAGGRQRTSVGELAIESVAQISASDVTEADAQAAGYTSRDAMLGEPLFEGDAPLWRIAFTLHDDPRIALRNSVPTGEELSGLLDRLAKKKARSGFDPLAYLQLIAANEGLRAPDMAEGLGLETKVFKRQVRQLKELGLTESLRVGYRISPRGHAVLAATRQTDK